MRVGSGRLALYHRGWQVGRAVAVPVRVFGSGGRKVRAPPGRMPANGGARKPDGQCHRNIPPFRKRKGKGEMAR